MTESEVTLTIRTEGDVCEAHLHIPDEWFGNSEKAEPVFLASIHSAVLIVDPAARDDFQALARRAMDSIVAAYLKNSGKSGVEVVVKTETILTPGEAH